RSRRQETTTLTASRPRSPPPRSFPRALSPAALDGRLYQSALHFALSMTAYLVTGGAGFSGSALVRHLCAQPDASVVTVDKLTYAGNLDSLATVLSRPNHTFERVDICDQTAVRRVFEEHRPDAVLHLAAESHVDRSIDGPGE